MTKLSANTFYSLFILSVLTLAMNVILATPAEANIYTYKDKNGRTVYSDVPIDERTKVHKVTGQKSTEQNNEQSDRQNIDSASNNAIATETAFVKENNTSISYKGLNITQPLAGSTINNFAGHFLVKINVDPSLGKSHKVQLVIDGIKQGANHSSSFKVNNAPNGDHQVQAQIIDGKGKVIISSATHSFKIVNSPK